MTVNALHPGLTNTGFGKNNPGLLMKIMGAVIPLIARSPEKGAATSIYLAASPEVQSISGKYFVDCKVTQPAPQAAIVLSPRSFGMSVPKWYIWRISVPEGV